MQLGVHLPQNEIGHDRAAILDFVQAAEGIGYDSLIMGEHVLAIDAPAAGLTRPYTMDWVWHEPFVLFAWLAAHTTRVRFMTSVMVLPLRQTALAARQAAEVDFLSGGRLMLGVGTGWNEPEFEAMGSDWASRGARLDEQVALMRELWSKPIVNFEGRYHHVRHMGITPTPRRTIPIWMGGMANVVLDRIGRIGDGWNVLRSQYTGRVSEADADADFHRRLARIHAAARKAGRDPAAIGIGTAIDVVEGPLEQQVAEARRWRELGATFTAIRTTAAGFTSLDQHLDAIRAFHEGASTA